MSESATKPRPQFRNLGLSDLMSYKLPPAGKASILHRVSGALLFLALPVILVPLFAHSVQSPETFAAMKAWVASPACKIVLLVLMWGYFHHFCAGIRYLTLDLHIGNDRAASQRSGALVMGVALALTVVFGLKLFGAW
ncbi:succinate dehydrogenase, cytochrome b556 subunit [uncultured Castellaniella sp.]|uniref:succinate dehydrogenase, cytochrome b556 subunit n=1 Tax=uncultured Castellaniella sp. TaxID=647907 RepID=UPI0026275867|nr:succinate dehydrogenase, cytochrome b556 subunit [uncultured Castellaniella sp.]